MIWYSHLCKNFPHVVVIHTIKGFGKVNETEVDVSLELPCFLYDPLNIGNLISIPLPFLNKACTSGSSQVKYC